MLELESWIQEGPDHRWLILGAWCALFGCIGALSALNKRVKEQYTIEFVATEDQDIDEEFYERGDIIRVAYFNSRRRQLRAAKLIEEAETVRAQYPHHAANMIAYAKRLARSISVPFLGKFPAFDIPDGKWSMSLGVTDEDTTLLMLIQTHRINNLCDKLEVARDLRQFVSLFFHDPVKWENWYMRRRGRGRRHSASRPR